MYCVYKGKGKNARKVGCSKTKAGAKKLRARSGKGSRVRKVKGRR
jgi:hypothetical protein